MKSMREMLKLMEGVMAVPGLDSHSTNAHVDEKAPPGREDQVKALKKEFPGDEERAFATAWASYNKSNGKKNEAVAGVGPGYVEEGIKKRDSVAHYYNQSHDQLDITRWLKHQAGLSKDAPVYFDDADLVYIDKTIIPRALVKADVTFQDCLDALNRVANGPWPPSNVRPPVIEEINGTPDVDLCKQSNPASARDACHMEENMMYQMEESAGKVQEIIGQLEQLSSLGYEQNEAFEMIGAKLAQAGYGDDEISELFHAVDHEMGNTGAEEFNPDDYPQDDDDMDSDLDSPTDSEEYEMNPDDSMDGDHASALASAGFGSDEDYGDYGGNDEFEEAQFPLGQVSPEKIEGALQALRQAAETGADPQSEIEWVSRTHNVPFNDLMDAWKKSQGAMEEAFDLQNGYDDIENANGQDYFPSGADSPVVKAIGGAPKSGDNPEQKRVAVAEETADLHKELVYNYRNYLKEEKKTKKDPYQNKYDHLGGFGNTVDSDDQKLWHKEQKRIAKLRAKDDSKKKR